MKINRFFGVLLCFFPGAAHLYLGLKKQGVQLMSLFFLPIFLSESIRISLFMFVIPVIWFYSFFDGLRKINGHEELVDTNIPVFNWFNGKYKFSGDKNKVLAYGLIIFGGFLLFERVLMPTISTYLGWRIGEVFHMGVISVLLILGGVKLLIGSKQGEREDKKW